MKKLIAIVMLCAAAQSVSAQVGSDVIATAVELGITPESLVLAELDPHADAILARIDLATDERAMLHQIKLSAVGLADQVTHLKQIVMASEYDPELMQSLVDAQASLDATMASIRSAREAIFESVMEGFEQEQVDRVLVWQSAGARSVPHELRSVAREDEEWDRIEVALKAEARANRRGEIVSPSHAAVLAQAWADPTVVQGRARLMLNLSQAQLVFAQWATADP